MASDMAITLSAQVALEKRLDTIANNVANMNTTGFRATGVKFDSLLGNDGTKVDYVSPGQDFISRKAGALTYTGNNLDVAVNGDAWFSVETPDGTAYTRNGSFNMTSGGDLQSANGYPVLDPGGGPITIDPNAGPVTIGDDGSISQRGKRIGAIGLFLLPDTAKLTRYDNSAVTSSVPADAVEDAVVNGVRQGYVESSNVNPILEMTKLIQVSRAFDNAMAAAQQNDQTAEDAIKTLAPG
jgi:flagellar basal-body rod protein FlgF